MKSTVRIDVDFDNQPIIRIEAIHSDDVRDKLVQRFIDSFSLSRVAEFIIHPHQTNGSSNGLIIIRPIPPKLIAHPRETSYDHETGQIHWNGYVDPPKEPLNEETRQIVKQVMKVGEMELNEFTSPT